MVEGGTVGEVVRNAAEERGNDVVFLFEDEAYTAREIDERSERAANGLAALGIGKGDHVALMMPNRPDWVWTWLGVAKLGAVLVPINTSIRGEGLSYILEHSDAALAVVAAECAEAFQNARSGLTKIKTVVSDGPFADVPLASVAAAPADPVGVDVRPQDNLEIIYTSGTTGLPKGVMTDHRNSVAAAMGMAAVQQLGTGKTVYCVLPLYHAAAQFVCFVSALMSGARVAVARRFSVSRFWDDIRRYNVTSFNYYGAMISLLHAQPPRPDDADNSVQLCFGAAAPKEIWPDFEQRFGLTIWEAYGQTEGGGLFNPPGSGKIGSMGIPVPGWEAKIVGEDGEEMPAGEIGELLFRPAEGSGRTLPEYYKDPESSAALTAGGWLHTGDFATCDADGFYYFVDRKNDFIRRRGMNISSMQVEGIIAQHPAIEDCAVYAIRSALGEDDVAVALVLREGQALSAEDLMGWCEERMAYYMVPRYVRFVAAIPRTESTGRIQKFGVKAEAVTADTWDREAAGYAVKR